MKPLIDVCVACSERNATGESPIWSSVEQSLYWVDIPVGRVHRLNPDGTSQSWSIGDRIGAVGLRRAGGLIATLPDGIYTLQLRSDGTAERTVLVKPQLLPDVRLKEGKVDWFGRYWFGSTGPSYLTRFGSLFRFTDGGECVVMDSGFILPNGLAFSPDGTTLAMADSPADEVYLYDFDAAGHISRRHSLFSTVHFPGYVDGATFDADGGYWCAMAYDGAIARIAPTGQLDRLIRVPTKYPTMCAFGGPDLNILYVTSSMQHVAEADKASEPFAGALFAIYGLGARGVPEPLFAG